MKRWLVYGMLAGLALQGFSACAPKAKEIPVDTCVKIFMSMAADENFRRSYQRPEDAPSTEIDKFAQPFGFTGEDFKLTMKLIKQDEKKNKEFNDISTKLLMDEAMKSLHDEGSDSTSNEQK